MQETPRDAAPTAPLRPVPAERDWEQLRARLARAVARVCPPWLAGDREDLVQVAMMRVMSARGPAAPGGDGTGELATSYLLKVAYSALIDEIRRRRRRKESDLDDELHTPRAIAADPGPEQRAAGSELGRAIQHCLGSMVRPRRMAVALYLRGHGVPEASRLLDWNRTRTENLVYRGLRDLRRCLDSKGLAP